jgi:hypothetical protein
MDILHIPSKLFDYEQLGKLRELKKKKASDDPFRQRIPQHPEVPPDIEAKQIITSFSDVRYH